MIGREADAGETVLAACSTLLPALLWYAWADHLVGQGVGSRASADNRSIWLGFSGPSALLKPETSKFVGWFLLVRAFTPLGAGLALVGLWKPAASRRLDHDRLWWVWGISALVAMALLAESCTTSITGCSLAPVAAVGVGRALDRLAGTTARGAVAVAAALLLLCWRSGPLDLADSCRVERPGGRGRAPSRRPSRADAWVAAPEALLFQADRRGCRMEWTTPAVRRAAGEWGTEHDVESPLDLHRLLSPPGCPLFRRPGQPRRATRRERACTTPSGDDTRSLWTAPRSSSPTSPIPGCTGMPTEAQPVTIPDF